METRIKKIRKVLNLSLCEFAWYIDLKKSIIGAWENSQSQIPQLKIMKISNVYDVNSSWLINGKGKMFKRFPRVIIERKAKENCFNADEKMILESYVDLSKKQRKKIIKLLKENKNDNN